ncbi:hypothetical protein LTR84_007798 [Exophiala bonariae]|uniref:CFEM domain-containing protein n=1 Tax=Exophiala bonariae TaxID=1690606 RepID=A0AAV9NL34_9EURO|nr:hypothetical protein LTR84_007798 [Exophiala bonariae]
MYSKGFSGAAALSGLAMVYAQGMGSLPPCASGAITQALGSTGCALSDTACICASLAFANIGTSIAGACSPEDVNAAIAAGQTICAAAPSVSSTTSSPPPGEPTPDPSVNNDVDVTYTTVSGTLTSTTIIPETTPAVKTTESTSPSTMHGNGTHTGPLTTTGTITVHPSGSGPPTGTGAPRQSTFMGEGATEKVHGLFAGAVGLIGALALV